MFKEKISLKTFLFFLPILIGLVYLIGKFSLLGFIGLLALIALGVLFVFILRQPFFGLLLVIFTLPFERIPTLDIGLFTLKMDQIFAGMTLFSWFLKLLFEKRKIESFPIGWSLIFFLFVSFISVLNAVDFSRALSVFIFVSFMILVSYLTTNLANTQERLSKVIKILFLSGLVVCLFGLYQFLGDVAGLPIELTGLKDIYTKAIMGFPRIQAFSMEPLYLANYLFIPLGIATSLFLFKLDKITSSKKLLILILLILVNIILGISRGAYIALGVFVLFFLIFLIRKVLTIRNIIIVIMSILIIGGTGLGFLQISHPDALAEFVKHATLEKFSEEEAVQKRLADFQKAIDFWQESPWIGIGPGNYGPAYKDYPSHEEVTDWEIVNNQYLETLTETGILGLIFLGLTFIILVWRSILAYFRTKDLFLKSVLIGLLAAFIAILVQYNFFSTLYIMHIWVLIGLIVAVQNLCLRVNKD